MGLLCNLCKTKRPFGKNNGWMVEPMVGWLKPMVVGPKKWLDGWNEWLLTYPARKSYIAFPLLRDSEKMRSIFGSNKITTLACVFNQT